jgi:hypothetical protein
MDWNDNQCSYATNEIAINWNASASLLAVALSASHQKSFRGPAWSPTSGVAGRRPLAGQLVGGTLRLQADAVVHLHDLRGNLVWQAQAKAGQDIRVPAGRGIRILTAQAKDGSIASWKVSGASRD